MSGCFFLKHGVVSPCRRGKGCSFIELWKY